MKKNSVASNYIFNLIYQVLVVIVPLITTPYISRVIGAKGIGIYSYCLSISTYFIVIGTLGFPIYGQREIAYTRENFEKRSKTFVEIFTCQCIALLILLIVFFLLFVVRKNQYSSMFFMVGMGIIATIFDITWFLGGLEEFKIVVGRNFLIKLASVIMIFTLVKNRGDLYAYALYIMLANLLGNLSLWLYVPRYVGKVKFKDLQFKRHIKPAIILLLPYSVTTLYAIIDKTMLGALSGSMLEVGFYEQSQKIITFSTAIVTSLGMVLMPRLAVLFSHDSKEEINKYLKYVLRFVCFITLPIMFGLIAISDNLVPWFFGEGFDKVSVLIKIFSPLALIMGLNNIIGNQYLVAIKKEKVLTVIILIGTICNCIFNALLIPYFNAEGAAIATIIGELLILVILMYINRERIDVTIIFKSIFKYLGYSFIMCIAIKFVETYFVPTANIRHTLILIAVGGIVYVIPLWIRKDELVIMIVTFVKNKINSYIK
ncbi:flippase [Clostridium sp. FP1]|uniref:flippase n=1 Tax=Clostridium sp. FP1 TaxID=2724076 RepID=UPI0013E90F8B|nr:flippase [Clostridium sp. FP1]MBZ9636620.1 flippase [Clostridium sp. FP1]